MALRPGVRWCAAAMAAATAALSSLPARANGYVAWSALFDRIHVAAVEASEAAARLETAAQPASPRLADRYGSWAALFERAHAVAVQASKTAEQLAASRPAGRYESWSALLARGYDIAVEASARLDRPATPPEASARLAEFDSWPALAGRAYAVAEQVSEAAARLDRAAAKPAGQGDPELQKLVAEASARFEVPEAWIRAVMRIESDGDSGATSPKGAMGLMQVMPATYAELSARYGLGDDPYAKRDNILAGSAFLREMYDRYGQAGFVAAYNAGPGRYEDCLTTGRALPFETQRYVASVRLAVSEDLFGKGSPFYEPIAISPRGELLAGNTGKPLPAADRLALHELVARAAKRAETKK